MLWAAAPGTDWLMSALRASALPIARRRQPVVRSQSSQRVPGPRLHQPVRRPFELETVASCWQHALDADDRALSAAAHVLTGSELAHRRRELVAERNGVAHDLAQLAKFMYVRPAPWLAPMPVTVQMLGLPATVKACIFDLEGVLTNSGALHAWAWTAAFDDFLQRVSERNGWHFIPFDRTADYLAYIDGRPRLQGVHAFLESRGIRIPEGRPDDPAEAETAYGLARRKSDALARSLHEHGIATVSGARRYLAATGHANLKRAVVSASARTVPMLELAGLAMLVDGIVDADVIRAERLRPRPAPDLLLAACRRIGVAATDAVTFTPSPAGVVAGLAAGLAVIGVGDAVRGELLRDAGAECVVPSLNTLLDRSLVERS
jgi:beta-phosphoglucomutase-like phosphatase (HAD superfamily)